MIKVKTLPGLAALAAVICVGSNTARAEDLNDNKINLDLAARVKSGFVAYQIGGLVSDGRNLANLHFPISELRFPLRAKTLQARLALPIQSDWKLVLQAETNGGSDSGVLEDRDWGISSTSSSSSGTKILDIYSESKSTLAVKEGNIRLEKHAGLYPDPFGLRTWKVNYGFGLLIQDYSYQAYDTVQSYPSSPTEEPDVLNGLVGTYTYRQYTPYAALRLAPMVSGAVSVAAEIFASPLARSYDHDNHILRSKTSEGETKGWTVGLAGTIDWQANSFLDVIGQVNYQKTTTNGTQTQQSTESGTPQTFEIKLKHISEQTNVSLAVRLSF